MLYKSYTVRKNKIHRNKEKIDENSVGDADGRYVYCTKNSGTNRMKTVAGYINAPLDASLSFTKLGTITLLVEPKASGNKYSRVEETNKLQTIQTRMIPQMKVMGQ